MRRLKAALAASRATESRAHGEGGRDGSHRGKATSRRREALGRSCPCSPGPGSAPELREVPAGPPRPAPTERRNVASSARPLRVLRP